MSTRSKIEWTDATWNPVTGCTKVSQGCKNCYAEREWPRLTRLVPAYAGREFTDVRTHADRIEQPLRWKKPRRVFVNSMSDLFHEAIPEDFILSVFVTMAAARQHTFQVLTKRAGRMHDLLTRWKRAGLVLREGCGVDLRNVWLGVSVEDKETANERIPLLLKTPAAVRWISAEPLLGAVDLTPAYLPFPNYQGAMMDPETGAYECCRECDYTGIGSEIGIDWVVVGGESGMNARPMHPDWARSLRDQCAEAGVPFLFKQWGEYRPDYDRDREDPDWRRCSLVERECQPGRWLNLAGGHGFRGERVHWVSQVGKKRAGRLLDGVQHDGYPETRP